MRRVGRPRDGDDINLNRDVYNDCVLLMILELRLRNHFVETVMAFEEIESPTMSV